MTNQWQDKLDNITQAGLSPRMRILFILVLALVLFGGYHEYKAIWPTPYVARQAGFQIVFPGYPTVNKLPSQDESGVKESGVIYSVENQAKNTDYAVYVTDYSSVNFASVSKDLKIEALNNEIEALARNDKSNLSKGKTITVENSVAVEATLTPTDSTEAKTQLLAFLNKSKLYMIFGTGMTQSKFDSFAKTFHTL